MKQSFFSLLALIATAFLGWHFAPDIFSDLTADRSTVVQSHNYRVVDASCSTTLGVFSTCHVDAQHERSGEAISFSYSMLANMDGASVYVMENAKTGYVTTNTGLEHLANRIVTLIAVMLVLAFIGITGLRRSFFGQRTHGRFQYR